MSSIGAPFPISYSKSHEFDLNVLKFKHFKNIRYYLWLKIEILKREKRGLIDWQVGNITNSYIFSEISHYQVDL